MNPTDIANFQEVAGLWRVFLAKHALPEPTVSLEEALTKLQMEMVRIKQRWFPPKVAVKGDLGAMLAAWQVDWTQELRSHADWPKESIRVAEAREHLDNQNHDDARYIIETLLSACCRGACNILAGSTVRAFEPSRQQPSDEDNRRGLEAVLRWLEFLDRIRFPVT